MDNGQPQQISDDIPLCSEGVSYISASPQNVLISGVLEPVFSHTEKLYLVSYYIQFSTNIARDFGISGLKNGFNLTFVHFYISGKLFII